MKQILIAYGDIMRSKLLILGWRYKNGELSIEDEEIKNMSILKSTHVTSADVNAFLIGYFDIDGQNDITNMEDIYKELIHLSPIVSLAKNKSSITSAIKVYILNNIIRRGVPFDELRKMTYILNKNQITSIDNNIKSIW